MPLFPSSRRSLATPVVLAVTATAVLLSTAPTAGAQTAGGAPAAGRSGRTPGPYSVTAYETVNIRSAPNTSSRAFDKIRAGETRSDALCWSHGETVRDHGYTNDVWIGFTEGWASAVYLKGNEYAGLPADATC
ncbi:SH3 domain-containing protein [Streptomyces sp. Edi4]|uniref:SH3 domain-containing protein n=1 Tax=Streptomyces sp. Edi4 TaxID=3162527 RepID=UPI003306019B